MLYFLIFLILVIIILSVWYYVSFIKGLLFTKSPYVPTFNRQLRILKKLNLDKGKKIVDLGCGDGKVLRFFEKEFGLFGFGYDVNSFAILYGKSINKIKKSNIVLFKGDFKKQDISNYDYIFLYLMPCVMDDLESWIFENKKKDAIVIVNTFPFPNKTPFKIVDKKVYLYK